MSQFFRLTFKFNTGTVLFSLFSSLLALYYFTSTYDFSLMVLPKLMIGIATIEGLDISKRVHLFYEAVLIFSLIFLLTNGILNYYKDKIEKRLFPITTLNQLSAFGILVIFSIFLNVAATSILNLLLSLLILTLFYFLFHKKYNSEVSHADLTNKYFEIVLVSISLSFLIKDIVVLGFHQQTKLFLNELILYTGIFTIICDVLLLKIKKWTATFGNLTLFISFLPIISFLAREIFLITLSRSILPNLQPGFVLFFLLVLLTIWFAIKRFRESKAISNNALKRAVFIFLSGIALITYYTPTIYQPTEMFELANPVLSFERYFNNGELPILESYNSHLFFELLYGFIYALLNGHSGLDFLTYNFLHTVVACVLIYLFIKDYTNNLSLSLLMVLFFPLLFVLFPVAWTTVLIVPFLLYQFIISKRDYALILLYLALTVLVVWKVDLGYAAIISVTTVLIILMMVKIIPIQLMALAKMILVLGGIVASVVLYAVLVEIPLWQNFQEALHYVSSSQTYGYTEISLDYGRIFYTHYFFFPLIILVILLYILKNIKTNMEQIPFQTLSLLFLGLFYFVNFHRGLIRHALLGSDDWVSSFAFFIIPAVIYFFPIDQKWLKMRPYFFLFTAFFLAYSFGYPEIKKVDFFGSKALEKFSEKDTMFTSKEINFNRIIGNGDFVHDQTGELNEFFQSNISEGATFYDYSNSPMLYYYLQKRVPSYFNQPLLSIHDEYLQKATAKKLESDDIPYIVYSNFPEIWYDNQDGVPKNLRHFYLGEYIQQNYKPYGIVGKYAVWSRIDSEDKLQLNKIQPSIDTVDLGLQILISKEQLSLNRIWISMVDIEGLKLMVDSQEIFSVYSAENKRIFHVETEKNKDVLLITNKLTDIELINCQYFPDNYSLLRKDYSLKYLPAIWARNIELTDFEWKSLNHLTDKDETYKSFYQVELERSKEGGAFLKIEASLEWGVSSEMAVIMRDGEMNDKGRFTFRNEKKYGETFLIRLSSQPAWYKENIEFIEITTDGKSKVKQVSICTDRANLNPN